MPVFRLGELTSDRSSIACRRRTPLSSLRRPVAASAVVPVERLLLRGKSIARLFACISCMSFVCGLSGIGCSIEYKDSGPVAANASSDSKASSDGVSGGGVSAGGVSAGGVSAGGVSAGGDSAGVDSAGGESSSNLGSSRAAARGENPQPAIANAGAPMADAANGPVAKTAPGEAAAAQAVAKKPALGEAPPGDTAADRTASSGGGEPLAGREGASGASPAPTPADPSKSGSTVAKRDILPIESTSRRAVVRENGLEVITFDDLNLGMQADMVFREFLLTDRARELDGKKVRLVGYMDGGVSQTKGIQEFVLLRNTECKFGPGGQADHLVRVLMKDGATADYSLNALQIEGVIKVNPFNGPDGNTWSVYDLIGEQVKTIRKK
jgi:hypothetical protein